MTWVYLLLVLGAGVLVAVRIIGSVRRISTQKADSWDEQLVKNLRTQGGDQFSPHEIDFFFSVPTDAQCAALAAALQPDGYTVDFRAMGTEGATGYTLHARKSLRVSVPEMKTQSAHMRKLADAHGASYDGWATQGAMRAAEPTMVPRKRRF